MILDTHGNLTALRLPVAQPDFRKRQVLVIGGGPLARRALAKLNLDDAVEVVGVVDEDGAQEPDGRWLGPVSALPEILMIRPLDMVFIALPIRSCYDQIQYALEVCERSGVETCLSLDLFRSAQRLTVETGPDSQHLVSSARPRGAPAALKRVLDFTAALLGILALSPLLLAIAAAVRLTSPGPALFRQQRIGLNRRRFEIYKFRTMRADAEALQDSLEAANEATGPVFKIRQDPRVTPLGRWLRSTSLDELPQLFNVLRGEMSLVGPRPLPVRDVSRFDEPGLMKRFSVKPGITGLWQIHGRGNNAFECWQRYDLKYIDDWSLGLDLLILCRTIPAVVRGSGAS